MGPDEGVPSRWITWPAGVIAALAWGAGRLTSIAFLDLIFVAAVAWLGGWLLSDFACRYLIRRGELAPREGQDEWAVDEPRLRPR